MLKSIQCLFIYLLLLIIAQQDNNIIIESALGEYVYKEKYKQRDNINY